MEGECAAGPGGGGGGRGGHGGRYGHGRRGHHRCRWHHPDHRCSCHSAASARATRRRRRRSHRRHGHPRPAPPPPRFGWPRRGVPHTQRLLGAHSGGRNFGCSVSCFTFVFICVLPSGCTLPRRTPTPGAHRFGRATPPPRPLPTPRARRRAPAGRHPSSMRIFASAADSAVAVVLSTARWTSLKWTARSKPLPVGLGTPSGSSSALAATTATAAAATTKSADRNMMAERGMRGRVEIAEKGEGGARSVRSKVEMRASGGERTSCGGIAAVHGPTLAVDRV